VTRLRRESGAVDRAQISDRQHLRVFPEKLLNVLLEGNHIEQRSARRNDKWQAELTYARLGDEKFFVPKNLHIIGTMNTADRSLAMVDYALRRRFVFLDLVPGVSSPGFSGRLKQLGVSDAFATRILARLNRLNATIAEDRTLGAGFCIGHSYFCHKPADLGDDEWYRRVVRTEVAPLLREYWFDNKARADAEEERLLEP
jgi:5-methylcytosine-specific restriction protein B